jgi:predicted ATPase
LLPKFSDGVWLAELAPLADPNLVPVTVAAAVGLELTGAAASPERVATALSGKNLLLLLDNCEHVIDAAAVLVEALLRASAEVQVIATGREALKAEGEWVYRVPPLAVPDVNAGDAGGLLHYGAVRLFGVRSRASGADASGYRQSAATIAAICRRLDGIPLAIELAAARAAALGIEALAARLDDRFQLLTGGLRTALPRHQTLRATLDWSYELLSEPERVVLTRLSIFAGNFALEAAVAVATAAEMARSEVVEVLSNLVAKSLVQADSGGHIERYRLLDTTRAYAFEKLAQSGELDAVARLHAEFYRDLLERAEAEREARPTAQWLADYGWRLDNVRSALSWAFSSNGNASIGVQLTAAAVSLWMHLSLMEECHSRAEQALASLSVEPTRDVHREMKLYGAIATSLTYTRGAVPELEAAWTKTLDLAEQLDDIEYQFRAVWQLWAFNRLSAWRRAVLTKAGSFCALAANRPDPNHRLVGEWMLGVSQHWLGDQARAAPSRRRACSVCRVRQSVTHHPLPGRSAGVGTHILGARILAAGISRPGDACGRSRNRRSPSDQSHIVPMSRSRFRSMPRSASDG